MGPFSYRWRPLERLISVEDYRAAAAKRVPGLVWDYVEGGADDAEAIESAIGNLVVENDHMNLFEAGRAVGAILQECDYWEGRLFWQFQTSGNVSPLAL